MCFSWGVFEQVLVQLVIMGAGFAILKILLPFALQHFGAAGPIIVTILTIIFWAFVIIVIIKFSFGLLGCLGGIHFPFAK